MKKKEKKRKNEWKHENINDWKLNKETLTKEPVLVFSHILLVVLLLYSTHWITKFVSLRHLTNKTPNKYGLLMSELTCE